MHAGSHYPQKKKCKKKKLQNYSITPSNCHFSRFIFVTSLNNVCVLKLKLTMAALSEVLERIVVISLNTILQMSTFSLSHHKSLFL